MIPPSTVNLATMLFRKKFTSVKCQSGLSNIVLGMSFITEGAILFATVDPMRVIGHRLSDRQLQEYLHSSGVLPFLHHTVVYS